MSGQSGSPTRNPNDDEAAGHAVLGTATSNIGCEPCQWQGRYTPAVGGTVKNEPADPGRHVCDFHRHNEWTAPIGGHSGRRRVMTDEIGERLRERDAADAPVWMDADEARGWAGGYNAALADLGLEQVGWWSSLGGFRPMHTHNTHWRPVLALSHIGRSDES
jgi:hypothetical protein